MLIRCPTCASGYDLPPEVLGDGRILRCAHCRDAWVHRGGGLDREGPEIVAEATSSRSPVEKVSPGPRGFANLARRLRLPGMRLFPRGAPGAGAALVAAALLLGGGGIVACRARVVARFPPSEAVFATLGLPVNLTGLALDDLRSTVASGDGPTVLTLQGRITNLRRESTPVPTLLIAVRDKDGRELYHWTATLAQDRLVAGGTAVFRSRLTDPPRDGRDLAVSFAAAPEPARDRRRVAEAVPSDR